jgi:hypothetical protein
LVEWASTRNFGQIAFRMPAPDAALNQGPNDESRVATTSFVTLKPASVPGEHIGERLGAAAKLRPERANWSTRSR